MYILDFNIVPFSYDSENYGTGKQSNLLRYIFNKEK